MRNLYEVLGFDITSDTANIEKRVLKANYRTKASKYHPDRNKDPDATERFQEIQQAWEVLGDDEARAQYDRDGTIKDAGALPEEVSIILQVFDMMLEHHGYADINYIDIVHKYLEKELSTQVKNFRTACIKRDKFRTLITNHTFTGAINEVMESKGMILDSQVTNCKTIERQLLKALELLEKFQYTGEVETQAEKENRPEQLSGFFHNYNGG